MKIENLKLPSMVLCNPRSNKNLPFKRTSIVETITSNIWLKSYACEIALTWVLGAAAKGQKADLTSRVNPIRAMMINLELSSLQTTQISNQTLKPRCSAHTSVLHGRADQFKHHRTVRMKSRILSGSPNWQRQKLMKVFPKLSRMVVRTMVTSPTDEPAFLSFRNHDS